MNITSFLSLSRWLAGARDRLFCGTVSLLVLLAVSMGWAGAVAGAEPVTIWCGPPSAHEVALTFDDGPSPVYTHQILTLLKQYQAKATFFVLGRKVEQYPEIIKAMVQDGHEIGNHTYDHPRLTKTAKTKCERELERTRLDLDLAGCPNKPQLMRPPYSAYDKQLTSYLTNTKRELVLWSLDSGDWKGLDSETIVHNVLDRVKNGSIIVFHDSDEKDQADRRPTVAALKVILPALQASGYRMVTISELANRLKPCNK
jgi:peptidoglycan/xylan/chitin deacetylase (PgdA/CDA1 family)